MRFVFKNRSLLLLTSIIIVLFFFGISSNLISDFLWFKSMGYQSTFLKLLFSKWGTRITTWLFFFMFLLVNLILTLKQITKSLNSNVEYLHQHHVAIKKYLLEKIITSKRLIFLYILVSIFVASTFSVITSEQWIIVQKFFNITNFNIVEPIFNKDISFYIFKLPFYQLLYTIFAISLISSLVFVIFTYFLFAPKESFNFKTKRLNQPQIHLTILLSLFLILKAWKYKLDIYGLLLSNRGVAFGASYTDLHAYLPAYNILAILSLVTAFALLLGIFIKMRKLLIVPISLLIFSSIILGNVYPGIVEKFQVEPNQFAKEEPYLEHNIKYTKMAYNLNNIAEKDFTASKEISPDIIKENSSTISNIRLWDWRPLQQTYNQLQGLRPYYIFNNIDIDRYYINGDYRQVMLAARELDSNSIPSKTWQNLRLRYTHGYGVVMSPVNAITPQGLPEFFIKNIPPLSSVNINVERPEIYFGEVTTNYVIVNTKHQEFDYPSGNDNVYNNYEGQGGIKLDSFLKKLLFAYKFKDLKILLSSDITSDSRILFDRDVVTMSEKIAPFLKYDKDPYLVISEGKLYWIRDAYTTSSWYPYSEYTPGWGNYIRNSVKVVIDAYDGKVDFYISDHNDPLILNYSKIFPGLFKSLDSMPADLRNHIKYPVDLLNVQAKIYNYYHMNNPQVFYNKEDAWTIPEEIYLGESQKMTPYYTIMQVPGETKPEYVLILPFTPANKQNMVSWLAARNDADNYGKLILFKFPKDKHVYGPAQIEARIDQNSEISQQLTLWDQRGSQVLRGNLLVIPIENTILYIEPLFLQAEQSNLPELRRVIVGFGNEIVMEEDLETALKVIFDDLGVSSSDEEVVDPNIINDSEEQIETDLSIEELIKQANQFFKGAQVSAQAGDWIEYGKHLQELQRTLLELEDKVSNNKIGGNENASQ